MFWDSRQFQMTLQFIIFQKSENVTLSLLNKFSLFRIVRVWQEQTDWFYFHLSSKLLCLLIYNSLKAIYKLNIIPSLFKLFTIHKYLTCIKLINNQFHCKTFSFKDTWSFLTDSMASGKNSFFIRLITKYPILGHEKLTPVHQKWCFFTK